MNIYSKTVHSMRNHVKKFLFGFLLLVAPLPAAATEILASGQWTNKGYDIHGEWKIVARDGGRYIVFDDDFKTRSGPDLKVYLSSRSLAVVTGETAASGSVEIAALQSPHGAQEYEIPVHLNLDDYRSLLIHCKAYSHLWGGGQIAP